MFVMIHLSRSLAESVFDNIRSYYREFHGASVGQHTVLRIWQSRLVLADTYFEELKAGSLPGGSRLPSPS